MKYFTLQEFESSAVCERYGIDNIMSEEVRRNVRQFVAAVLDPLREKCGFPIIITSGYRCEFLNEEIGTDPNSPHLYGRAADVRGRNPMETLQMLLVLVYSGLPFDRLKVHMDNSGRVTRLHIDWRPTQPRRAIQIVRS